MLRRRSAWVLRAVVEVHDDVVAGGGDRLDYGAAAHCCGADVKLCWINTIGGITRLLKMVGPSRLVDKGFICLEIVLGGTQQRKRIYILQLLPISLCILPENNNRIWKPWNDELAPVESTNWLYWEWYPRSICIVLDNLQFHLWPATKSSEFFTASINFGLARYAWFTLWTLKSAFLSSKIYKLFWMVLHHMRHWNL